MSQFSIHWTKYSDIKRQQWNQYLYFKAVQSGNADVESMSPPSIQLTPEEKVFFKCVEYYRKLAKTNNNNNSNTTRDQVSHSLYSQVPHHPYHFQQNIANPCPGSLAVNGISGQGAATVDHNSHKDFETSTSMEEHWQVSRSTRSPFFPFEEPVSNPLATASMHRVTSSAQGRMQDALLQSPSMLADNTTNSFLRNAVITTAGGIKTHHNVQVSPVPHSRTYAQSHLGTVPPPMAGI
ncbi:hypothetical protein RFI_16794 [Reticulomyxa filosa]|uniref:Uncharacterized protein n=1 Tax=Reticulomyxa filosa TaxID=46433 RepID=X6N3W3_RETFI|nr:hypothetical protein RFI_16794 [Reticulomyxa filosa]|eukprot:ETO20424.1 hypothetical protein RFI_16794 [Reticulomyxa filosa]